MTQTRHLIRFFGLTFAISWTCWALSAVLPSLSGALKIAGTFRPAIAAPIVVWPDRAQRRALFVRLVQWRVPLWVWLWAFVLPVAGLLLALLAANATTGGPIWPDPMPLWVPIVVFAYVLVFSVAGEELGWRGVAMPPLIMRFGPIWASLGLGVVWALWHAPLFLLPGDFHSAIPPLLFGLQIVASSVVYTQLHLAGGGSLIPAHLFHASFNASVGIFPVLPQARDGDLTALGLADGVLCLVALVVSVRLRSPSA